MRVSKFACFLALTVTLIFYLYVFVDAKGHLPEISAATCIPSTSRQSPKFISQSNLPTLGSDVGNRSECFYAI